MTTHVHPCKTCAQDVPCHEDCTIEVDLGVAAGNLMRGAPVECVQCLAKRGGVTQEQRRRDLDELAMFLTLVRAGVYRGFTVELDGAEWVVKAHPVPPGEVSAVCRGPSIEIAGGTIRSATSPRR